jgi:adhesin transport system outer membrane protein
LVVDSQAQLDQAYARYRQIFGSTPGAVSSAPLAPKLPGNIQNAVSRSPRLRSINSELLAAEAKVEQAKSLRFPRAELSGTARRDGDGRADLLVDLSLEYTFDTRREAASAVDRANAELQSVRAEKSRLLRDVMRALEFLQADRVAADKRLNSARAAAAANLANVSAAAEEFSIGRKTLIEVLDAQRDFVRAEETVLSSKRQQTLVGYETLALTGDIISAFGISLPDPVTVSATNSGSRYVTGQ